MKGSEMFQGEKMDLKSVRRVIIMLTKLTYRIGAREFLNPKFQDGDFKLYFKDIKAYGRSELATTQKLQDEFNKS